MISPVFDERKIEICYSSYSGHKAMIPLRKESTYIELIKQVDDSPPAIIRDFVSPRLRLRVTLVTKIYLNACSSYMTKVKSDV